MLISYISFTEKNNFQWDYFLLSNKKRMIIMNISSASFKTFNVRKHGMKKWVTVVLHTVKITPMPLADYETTSRETYSELCEISRMEPFEKNRSWLKIVNYFRKNLHLRCLTGVWIRLWYLLGNILSFQWRILAHRIFPNKRMLWKKGRSLISTVALSPGS